MTFDVCPGEYKARYVDGQPFEMTEAVAFGQAVHQGLEAHYRGGDGEGQFRKIWKDLRGVLENAGIATDPKLTATGLSLLDQVYDLDLQGIPERPFSLDTPELGAPIVGAIDLWGQDTIYDFKTTYGSWSQARAEREVWQPVLYAWAYWDETDRLPDFEYIVLNRATRAVSRFRRHWEPDGYLAQLNEAWLRMRTIWALVEGDELHCHGNHGFCPECGDRWAHDHACTPSARIRL